MKFSATRKALKKVKRGKLQKDLEDVVSTIEKASNRRMASKTTNELFSFVVALRESIAHKTRFAIVNAIFDDALKAEVPHQWERKEGFECGPKNDCSKPNEDKNCCHDTSGPSCISG